MMSSVEMLDSLHFADEHCYFWLPQSHLPHQLHQAASSPSSEASACAAALPAALVHDDGTPSPVCGVDDDGMPTQLSFSMDDLHLLQTVTGLETSNCGGGSSSGAEWLPRSVELGVAQATREEIESSLAFSNYTVAFDTAIMSPPASPSTAMTTSPSLSAASGAAVFDDHTPIFSSQVGASPLMEMLNPPPHLDAHRLLLGSSRSPTQPLHHSPSSDSSSSHFALHHHQLPRSSQASPHPLAFLDTLHAAPAAATAAPPPRAKTASAASRRAGSSSSISSSATAAAAATTDEGSAVQLSPTPPGATVGTKTERPNISYARLAAEAILSSATGRLTVGEIYDYITTKYPFYGAGGSPFWKNSVRHNLSTHKFQRVAGKNGHLWELSDTYRNKLIRKETGKATVSRKRRRTEDAPSSPKSARSSMDASSPSATAVAAPKAATATSRRSGPPGE